MATEVISREAQQQYPRWPVAATKTVRVDLGPAGGGHIVNVSFGGIRIKSLAPLRRETELPLCIYVPDLSPMQCSGVVVWSKPDGAAGLKFTHLADDQKAILGSWLKELEHSSGDSAFQRDEFARTTAQISAMKLNNADALRFIARRVVQISSASGVSIALGKPENLVCLARLGEAAELGSAIHPTGLVGECIRGRKMVVCHDAATDPRAGERKDGSELIVPMLVNGELRGLIQVVSPKAHAFDVKCMETVEKLADAAVFVTHNVMPQRRVASVTPMPKPAGNIAPPVMSVSETGSMRAYTSTPKPVPAPTPLPSVTSTLAAAPTKPLPVVSVAETPVEPAPAPVRIVPSPIISPQQPAAAKASPAKSGYEFDMAEYAKARQSVSSRVPAYHPQARRSAKLILAIPFAAVVVLAIPVALHFRHSSAVPTVAAASPVATMPAAEPIATAPVSSPAISHSTMAAVAPAAKPIPVTESVTHEKKAALVANEPHKPAKAEPPPEPVVAPIVLAASAPVERHEDEEPDVAAPSAPQLAMKTTPTLPGISIPTTTSAPKLAAPISKPLTGGTLVQRMAPLYPRVAMSEGIEGQVQLRAVITTTGAVENVRSISGHPLLVQAAMEAVRHWKYDPFRSGGVPIEGEVTITLNFKIPR